MAPMIKYTVHWKTSHLYYRVRKLKNDNEQYIKQLKILKVKFS